LEVSILGTGKIGLKIGKHFSIFGKIWIYVIVIRRKSVKFHKRMRFLGSTTLTQKHV